MGEYFLIDSVLYVPCSVITPIGGLELLPIDNMHNNSKPTVKQTRDLLTWSDNYIVTSWSNMGF